MGASESVESESVEGRQFVDGPSRHQRGRSLHAVISSTGSRHQLRDSSHLLSARPMDVPVTLWVAAHATCLEFFVLRSVDAARSGAVRSDAVVIVIIMVSTRIYNNGKLDHSASQQQPVVCTHHSGSRAHSGHGTTGILRQPGVDDPDEELEEAVDGVSVGPEAFHLANDLPAVKAARLVEVRLDQRPPHAVHKPRKHPQ